MPRHLTAPSIHTATRTDAASSANIVRAVSQPTSPTPTAPQHPCPRPSFRRHPSRPRPHHLQDRSHPQAPQDCRPTTPQDSARSLQPSQTQSPRQPQKRSHYHMSPPKALPPLLMPPLSTPPTALTPPPPTSDLADAARPQSHSSSTNRHTQTKVTHATSERTSYRPWTSLTVFRHNVTQNVAKTYYMSHTGHL
jgi:hypothetical protein